MIRAFLALALTLCLSAHAYEYFGHGVRWPGPVIHYRIMPGFPPRVLRNVKAGLQWAFTQWRIASLCAFSFAPAGRTDTAIEIFYAFDGSQMPFDARDMADTVLTWDSGLIRTCQIVINGEFVKPFPDMRALMMHEIGHALGLAHSNDPFAVMFPQWNAWRRYPDPDDILGIRRLYPQF